MGVNNILAVDTSSRVLSVAIGTRTSAVFESNLEGTPQHSEQLLGLIAEGLKDLGLKKHDLTHLIWGLGPGSFTGLRIGLSVLKGFSLGLKKRCFGVSSLDVIALGSGVINGDLIVCLDARREHLYVAQYRFQKGQVKKVLSDRLLSFDHFLSKLKPGMTLTGDAISSYGELIQKKKEEGISFLPQSFWYPKAHFMLKLLAEKHEWVEALTLRKMVPKYLRISEAEEKWSQKKHRRK
ncbi:MAG: tRNA (adenosine(37)-N6)-threonylcarbamoyltransferase complex dimerization subunit type 1 TsaB [Omnitrophica bacterium RIFCSPHIGHO2_02_FULL_46_11]|nr:MAG: tRNA (adenosine(37)-N6)-threonylcarbamoyltransferase complex dimerization subunit type 1 TsaB [Omnitrophica bacterium RIFCSPHIGHO2_02_FULL_46_11]OGW86176.1 MAG: tRNA (adenosine(37)-N6)-threonylcarbamoyltransferase complex dimerization subunit type 1 TsaB [Omnitrophica bacterium RIFCSPLOWO2_01_FULL_45_10b]